MSDVIIWDADGLPSADHGLVIFWNSYSSSIKNSVSIPRVVEEKAESLRQKYLGWVYAFGKSEVLGKSIVDHLEIRPGFSAWWMSLIVEKSMLRSPRISQAIKLIALEDCLKGGSFRKITLQSADKNLAHSIRFYCEERSVDFVWKRTRQKNTGIYFPSVIKAIVYFFKYVWKRRLFSRSTPDSPSWEKDGVLFVDYLLNISGTEGAAGAFSSKYWTLLVDALKEFGQKSNWLHLCFISASVPSFQSAKLLIDLFNKKSEGTQRHEGFDSFLSVRVAVKALADYAKLAWISFSLPDFRHLYRMEGSDMSLYFLMGGDWKASTRGQTAMWNMIALNLFERALSVIPHQKQGVFLQENMGWERALIHAWKKGGHGRLIGAPHTTVRFWDLRYFMDPRSYSKEVRNPLPMPDLVAVNGPLSQRALSHGGYPDAGMAEVEALRYLFLINPPKKRCSLEESNRKISILVCGDILQSANHSLMTMLQEACATKKTECKIILKNHPATKIDLSDYPALHCTVSELPVHELALHVDYVIASNITSASLDAYCTGSTVIQIVDGKTLNFSPLRGLQMVNFVSHHDELASALELTREGSSNRSEHIFFLDGNLPRWKSLLIQRL